MTKPKVLSVQMQRLLAFNADYAELTNDQLFTLLRLVVSDRKEEAIALLHTMLTNQKDVVKFAERLKYLEIEAAEKLLLENK